MLVTRRSLITGFAAVFLASPAIVRATSIMPISPLPPQGAYYWPEWKACMDGLLASPASIRPLLLTPWQIENLAKPSGYREGRDYVLARPFSIAA